MVRWLLSLALTGALIQTGCGSQQSLKWSPASKTPTSYERTLKDWTRAAVAYDTIESRFFVTATFLSPHFNAAYIRERARVGGLAPDEIQEVTSTIRAREDQGLSFFIALAAQDPNWNDLGTKGSTLGARLFTDAGAKPLRPLSIHRLSTNELADYRPYFKYADELRTGYIVTFPHDEKTRELRLRIGGTPGMVQLRWVVDQ